MNATASFFNHQLHQSHAPYNHKCRQRNKGIYGYSVKHRWKSRFFKIGNARTETDIIRQLTEDDASFRSLTRSWFEHSELFSLLKMLSERGHTVIITSDHGTVRVDNPVKVTGDRETSTNLRYKTGRNLAYNRKEVFEITKPEEVQLPSSNLTSSYIFAYNNDFLVYNNDANRHIRYYRDTFQHGGISMEEMIVPYIVLQPKR